MEQRTARSRTDGPWRWTDFERPLYPSEEGSAKAPFQGNLPARGRYGLWSNHSGADCGPPLPPASDRQQLSSEPSRLRRARIPTPKAPSRSERSCILAVASSATAIRRQPMQEVERKWLLRGA